MINQLAYLYLALEDYISPLLRRLSSLEALEYLFFRYGWNIPLNDAVYAKTAPVLNARAPIEQFLASAKTMRDKAELSLSDVGVLAEKAAPVVQALADLAPAILEDLPEPLNQQAFWSDITDHLLDDLLEEYLRIYHPPVYLVLHLWGAVRYEPVRPSAPHRVPYTRIVVDWEQAGAILRNPLESLTRSYRWGDPALEFEHQRFFDALERVLQAIQIPAKLVTADSRVITAIPADAGYQVKTEADALRAHWLYRLSLHSREVFEAGVELSPAVRTGQQKASGLVVSPVLRGGPGATLPLGRGFALRWNAAVDASQTITIALFPDRVAFTGGAASLGAGIEVFSTRTEPWFLIGNARTARVEVSGLSIRLAVEGTPNSPEAKLHLKTAGPNGAPGCKIVVPLEESDGFVKKSLKAPAVEFSFSPEVIWSSRTGLSFNGKPNIEIQLTLNIKAGAFTIQHARIAVIEGPKTTANTAILVRVDLGIHGKLGPIQAVIERIGFACVFIPYTRDELRSIPPSAEPPTLGSLDIKLEFAPPQGIGLGIDTSGIVGAGYLFFDPLKEEYAGLLQLELAETIALTAIGLLTTRMPDGSKGFSLIISITAQGFQPIQLGLGFRLSGVGGLVGVNRTVAVEVLRSGLKNGTLDAVLFPKDPLRNIAQIVSDLRNIFPPAEGRFVFGPIVVIDWGTPPVITMDLAVILELPSPARIVVLGQIRSFLPKEDKALIRLNMDVLGVLELDKGELSIDATLYDSRIVGLVISGDMALRARWLTDPTFVMSVGGLNPNFRRPVGFPNLKRIALSLTKGNNPRVRLEGYLALTSNTAQIGARLDLRVAAAGFSIEGYLSFDALFQFSPFQFIIDMAAGVTLKWHGRTLLGVQLQLTLAGPSPWHARGKARFKIWIFSKSVSFDKTFGKEEKPPVLPPADPLPELLAALGELRSWGGGVPAGGRALVSLREGPGKEDLMVHPIGRVSVRQRVVPLDIQISKFGNTVPAGERRFRITQVLLDGQAVKTEQVKDYFAPGQFLELTEAQSLTRPSFEQLPSGIELTADPVSFGGQNNNALMTTTPVAYDTKIIPGDAAAAKKTTTMTDAAVVDATAVGAAARAAARRSGTAKYRGEQRDVAPQDARYVVAKTDDLTPVTEIGPEGTSYTAAAEVLSQHVAQNRNLRGRLKIVAAQELTGASS